jgi:hypothetical protein
MEPDRVEVHCWTRTVSGDWRRERFESLEDEIAIRTFGKVIKVRDLYDGLL